MVVVGAMVVVVTIVVVVSAALPESSSSRVTSTTTSAMASTAIEPAQRVDPPALLSSRSCPSSFGPSSIGLSSREVDEQRRVIGRLLALARVAVDDRPRDAVGERARHEREVDAHAAVLVEVAAPVVPVGEEVVGVVLRAERVDEAPLAELVDRARVPAR